MSDLETYLDHILVPRPNGSEGLEQTANFLLSTLQSQGASISEHAFTATPYGFQMVWCFAVILMAAYSFCLWKGHYRLAAAIPAILAVILVLEFEYLYSPVSGLLAQTERNIIGTWPGDPGASVLVFTAHYDTATHFGDHFSWGRWGKLQGPATGLAIGFPLLAFWLTRRGRKIPRVAILATIPLSCAPFVMMFWFQSVGPLLRTPSIGAIDNGGSVAALLLLGQELQKRPANTGTTVKIVFLAAEEERTLGSWSYATALKQEAASRPLLVVNLESIGTTDDLAYIPEDGFATRRFTSSQASVNFVNSAARKVYGRAMEAKALPFGTLTDGRSFLAHNIEAITLRSFEGDQFPRRLHSEHDSRDRLSLNGINRSVQLLSEIVALSDSGHQIP